MPKSFGSTASRWIFGSISSLNIASSEAASRCRGPSRSTGTSLQPSGIHTLVTVVVPSWRPISAPILRQAIPCSIQNWRALSLALESVQPSLASGCEKNVALKSSPTPCLLGPVDPALEMRRVDLVALDLLAAEVGVRGVQRSSRCLPGRSDSTISRSLRSSSSVRARPG